ncbi:MAG TPA: cupin domain-containing protein [Bryobacteraceae bacterium]|nr:cupin domain-containing protein [Bryobacteraceae bacterium]
MSVPTVHEDEIEGLDLPGRNLRWLVNSELLGANHMSVCLIKVAPGDKVRPAHSHPNGEETIYIVAGEGRVLVDGDVSPVKTGSIVLFPQGKVHMLQNTGAVEMKVICFFAPAANLDNYQFFNDIDFPD